MTINKDEFHRLASSVCRDWLNKLILDETNDPDLAMLVMKTVDAISWHEFMKEAYSDTEIAAGDFNRNTYIAAPIGIYNELKRMV